MVLKTFVSHLLKLGQPLKGLFDFNPTPPVTSVNERRIRPCRDGCRTGRKEVQRC